MEDPRNENKLKRIIYRYQTKSKLLSTMQVWELPTEGFGNRSAENMKSWTKLCDDSDFRPKLKDLLKPICQQYKKQEERDYGLEDEEGEEEFGAEEEFKKPSYAGYGPRIGFSGGPVNLAGVFRLTGRDFEVHPKGSLGLAAMQFMFLEELQKKAGARKDNWDEDIGMYSASGPWKAPTLDPALFVVNQFARTLEVTFDRELSLQKGSVSMADRLWEVRGVIDVETQLERGLLAVDGRMYGPVECCFDEFSFDTANNRMLREALEVCASVLLHRKDDVASDLIVMVEWLI